MVGRPSVRPSNHPLQKIRVLISPQQKELLESCWCQSDWIFRASGLKKRASNKKPGTGGHLDFKLQHNYLRKMYLNATREQHKNGYEITITMMTAWNHCNVFLSLWGEKLEKLFSAGEFSLNRPNLLPHDSTFASCFLSIIINFHFMMGIYPA